MKIILCSAIKKEIYKIIKHFNANLLTFFKNKYYIYYYNKNGTEIYFIITGVGYKNIKKNLDYFIKEYKPDNDFLWILTGYAGSTTCDFKIGDIVIPALIRNEKKAYRPYIHKFFKLKKTTCLFEVAKIYGEKEKTELMKKYSEIDTIDIESASFCEVMEKYSFKNYF